MIVLCLFISIGMLAWIGLFFLLRKEYKELVQLTVTFLYWVDYYNMFSIESIQQRKPMEALYYHQALKKFFGQRHAKNYIGFLK